MFSALKSKTIKFKFKRAAITAKEVSLSTIIAQAELSVGLQVVPLEDTGRPPRLPVLVPVARESISSDSDSKDASQLL